MSLPFEIPPVPDESAKQSPFTPTFGAIPPLLADRQNLINDFAYALDSGPGARGRATLVTGTRGVGKSVMLRVFREVADSRQWLTVSAQATPGFVDRLTTARLPEALSKMDTPNTRQRSEEHTSELQSRFDLVCRLLLEKKNNRSGVSQ